MAEQTEQSEKTEDPTRKRLEDAHKRGDVVKSMEVNAWFALLVVTLVCAFFSTTTLSLLSHTLAGFLAKAHSFSLDGKSLNRLWLQTGREIFVIIAIPFLFLFVAAIASNLLQHRLVWSLDPIKPKLSKISILKGLKRLFSAEALVNFLKGLIKLGFVSMLMVFVLWPQLDQLRAVLLGSAGAILPLIQDFSLRLLGSALIIMTLVAVADYAWQRHRWFQRQKMSLKEVRDELKESDGDPAIKAKIRQIRMTRGRARMMARVPEATVVIMNPTHYAVALKYEDGMNAPICLAKGIDVLALKIRDIAREVEVPIVQNPPLARTLYASVEVDQEIPETHYKAVAEIIGTIMRLRK